MKTKKKKSEPAISKKGDKSRSRQTILLQTLNHSLALCDWLNSMDGERMLASNVVYAIWIFLFQIEPNRGNKIIISMQFIALEIQANKRKKRSIETFWLWIIELHLRCFVFTSSSSSSKSKFPTKESRKKDRNSFCYLENISIIYVWIVPF